MKKYTIFYDQINRTNFQIKAENKFDAREKGKKLYLKKLVIPIADIQEGWLSENDGEDK